VDSVDPAGLGEVAITDFNFLVAQRELDVNGCVNGRDIRGQSWPLGFGGRGGVGFRVGGGLSRDGESRREH